MVLFNYATKEITAKIVYYGPGLCGKTTNLQFVYDSLPSNNKSKMLSLATKTDRTLFFDFLPLDLGKIRGMRTKLQLYTVPGQVYYNSTRQLVLKGADGVVFVADSQDFAVDANLESLQNLEDNLKRQGVRIGEIPLVMQFNKRDLPNALPVPELEESVNRLKVPTFESVATTGFGVEETLKGITQLVLEHLVMKYGLEGSEPIEKELQVLNAPSAEPRPAEESVWSDENVLSASSSQTAASSAPPAAGGEGDPFVLEDADEGEQMPMVETELVSSAQPAQPFSPRSPFDEVLESFSSKEAASATVPQQEEEPSVEVPVTSVEIPLPGELRRSLPVLGEERGDEPPPAPAERRVADGLVREVTLPLNISVEELRRHKKLKLRITLDVNLLP